jgi:phage/plasmid-associated DNA primase
MHFICSVNTKVVQALDAVSGKIEAGGDYSSFNSGWESQNLSADQIAEEVAQSKGLCAWHLVNGKRVKGETGLIHAGLIIIDIDNQADGKDQDGNKIQKQELTWEQAQQLDICKKYLSLAYDSPSTKPGWPRFRLVFGLEKPIFDGDFYQWFTRAISKDIPGSDIRATQVPNLFYGSKSKDGILYTSDKFIPSSKIDEALKVFHSLPKESLGSKFDVTDALEDVVIEEDGVSLEKLVSRSVKDILEGKPVDDRSLAVTRAVKEILGWTNWLRDNGISSRVSPLTVAHRAFYAVYAYPAEIDGKFTRIVESIRDVESIRPAIVMASEHDDIAAWKRLKSVDLEAFNQIASDEIKEGIKQTRAKSVNSILTFDDFSLDESPATTKTTTPTKTPERQDQVSTPQTPAQLVNLQNAQQQNRAFAENDVAEIIATNQGDNYLYDSTHDNFYTYDNDTGIWYVQDEMHVKKRIVNALDTFVSAGVLPKYQSSTVNSVYAMLQAKMLRSLNGGRTSIFNKGRGYIPFSNGALDSETFEFEPGKNKDLFFRSRLLYEWDQQGKCPKFLAWLDSSLRKGQGRLIQAFARALLTGYTSGERFLHLVGPGGTGKSTMQQLMIALAGFNSTHTSSLELIETNKFESYNLIGKRLLLLTDESNYNKRMDVLKKLTSASDTLRAERKYGKEIISFKPECLVCIASNEHISSNDSTSGLERRRLTIVMDQVVPPSQRRELLSVYGDRLEGDFVKELPGIVSWALSMPFEDMRDVLANPVKHAPSLARTNIDALVFNNQYVAWMAECCLYAPNTATVVGRGAARPSTDESEKGMYVKNAFTELYASYANFCKACGYKAAAKPRFVERTMETLCNILKLPHCTTTTKNGLAAIKGLRLKPFDLTSDRASHGDTRLPNPVEFAQEPEFAKWENSFNKHDANT